MRHKLDAILAAAALACAAATAALAVTPSEIQDRGTVLIGVLTCAPRMGMVDERGNPAGHDVDVANLIGEMMGLPTELVMPTPPARIPALQTGQVDFLVAPLAPTGERAKTVMFTTPCNAFNMVVVSGPEDIA